MAPLQAGVGTSPIQKTVLIIAHEFPPIGGIGVQRPHKFAQYLPEFGWQPVVLTQVARYSATWDESLLSVLAETPIFRATDPMTHLQSRMRKQPAPTSPPHSPESAENGAEPSHGQPAARRGVKRALIQLAKRSKDRLLIPDETALWLANAVSLGMRVISERHVDAIYATSPPATSLLVAAILSERTGVPLVIDFRDPWVSNLHRKQRGFRHELDRVLEAFAVRRATRVVTVTDSFRRDFALRYPDQANKFLVIPNGYDRKDLAATKSEQRTSAHKMTIYYGGILYGKRSPKAFLEGLAAALRTDGIARDRIRVEFAGVFDYPGKHDNQDLIRSLGLTDVVEVVGYVAHAEHVQRMADADVLLLIGDQTPGAGSYVPAKLYEYLGMSRPILAMVQPGEASHLVEECRAGLVSDPADSARVSRNIAELYQRFEQGTLAHWEQSTLATLYERREQTRMLAEQLDTILHG